jgi:hypothetical protein
MYRLITFHNASFKGGQVVVGERIQRHLRVEVVTSVPVVRSIAALERVRNKVFAARNNHCLASGVDARWVLRNRRALQSLDKVGGVLSGELWVLSGNLWIAAGTSQLSAMRQGLCGEIVPYLTRVA